MILFALFPSMLWKLRRKQMKRLCLDKNYLVVTCDCDTDLDVEALLEIDDKFSNLGIPVAYAAPSELILRNSETFRLILNRGRNLINHGFKDHVRVDPFGGFSNNLVYSALSREEIRKDFVDAHYFLKDNFGYTAKIFRTPHFGEFRKRRQMRIIHNLCRNFEYEISSSTTGFESFFGLKQYNSSNLVEIPLTGFGKAGFSVLDSWSFRKEQMDKDIIDAVSFFDKFEEIQNRYRGVNSFYNIYFDPRHILNSDIFWTKLESMTHTLTPIDLFELSRRFRRRKHD